MDKTIENVNYILEYTSKRVLKTAKDAEKELDEFRSSMNENPDDKELNTLATLRKNAIQKRAVANYYQKKFDNIIKNSKDGIEEFLVVASVDEDLGQTYENTNPDILMINLDEICKDVTSEAVTMDIMNAFSPYAGSATPEDIRIDFGIDSLENEEEISNVIDELYNEDNGEFNEDSSENSFAVDLGENPDAGSSQPDEGYEEMYSSVPEYGYEEKEDSTEDPTKGSFAPDDVKMNIEDDIIIDDFYESDVAGSVTPEELRINIEDDSHPFAGSSTQEELKVNIEEGNPYAGSRSREDLYVGMEDEHPFAGSSAHAEEDEEPIDEEYSYENDIDPEDHPFAGSSTAEELRVHLEEEHPFAGSSAHAEEDEIPYDEDYSYEDDIDPEDHPFAGSSVPEELRIDLDDSHPFAGSSESEDLYVDTEDTHPFAGSSTPDMPIIYEKDYSDHIEGDPLFDPAEMAGSNVPEELRVDIDEFDNPYAGSNAHAEEDEDLIEDEYSYENDVDPDDHPFAGSATAEELRVHIDDEHPFAGSSAHYEDDELVSEDVDDTDEEDSDDINGGSTEAEEIRIYIEDDDFGGSTAHYEDDEVVVDNVESDETEEDDSHPFAGSSAAEELRIYIDDMDGLDVGSTASDDGEVDDEDIEDFLNEMRAKMLNDDLNSDEIE